MNFITNSVFEQYTASPRLPAYSCYTMYCTLSGETIQSRGILFKAGTVLSKLLQFIYGFPTLDLAKGTAVVERSCEGRRNRALSF